MKPIATHYPYAGSRAAQMLSEALAIASAEYQMSTRKLAKVLDIKQASVISHMANGRLAIPVERAAALAKALKMDARAFLLAVLEQRFPTTDWSLIQDSKITADQLSWIRTLSGVDPTKLTAEQLKVIAEAARDYRPSERWLPAEEVSIVRRLRESTKEDEFGMTEEDWKKVDPHGC